MDKALLFYGAIEIVVKIEAFDIAFRQIVLCRTNWTVNSFSLQALVV